MKKLKILVPILIAVVLIIGFSHITLGGQPGDQGSNRTFYDVSNTDDLIYDDLLYNNNVYCIEHGQHMDNDNYKTYNLTTKVEINGEEAKFYDKNGNHLKTVTNKANNVLACILSYGTVDKKGTSQVSAWKQYGYDYSIGHAISWGGEWNYTDAQLALYTYYDDWVSAINSSVGQSTTATFYGFTWFQNISDSETTEGKLTDEQISIADAWVTKANELANNWSYHVTLYLLTPETASNQNLIVADPEDPTEANTQVKVTKAWVDGDNAYNTRPSSITVTLYAGATAKETKTLTGDSWTATFSDLPIKDEKGNTIQYTVKEATVSGYALDGISEDQTNEFTITNRLKTEVTVTKQWDDLDNLDDIRPQSITVTLYSNEIATNKTVTLNESNNWTATFTDLYKYDTNGDKIIYTVEENSINGYTPEYSSTEDGKNTTITIKNTHTPNYDGYIEISGKVWLDGNGGKANEINGNLGDKTDKGLGGIKVVLRDANGNQFDATSTATTDSNGNYTIKVNYDNSSNVYKLYENADTVREKLKTAYVEFEYDAIKYTTVATATEGENTSKAKENETTRNEFDNKCQTVTPSTDISKIYDGNTSSTWKDLSRNRDGNINGAIFENNYLLFDGVNDWVNAGQVTFTDESAVETIIEINAIQSGEIHIIGNYENGGAGLVLYDGVPASSVYIEGIGYVEAIGNEALQVGRKYNIAGTYDGTSVKLYIDGDLVKETKTFGKIRAPQKNTIMAIGANPSGNGPVSSWINAKIYDAKVYNKALTQAEISQNISGSDIVSRGLIRHYSVGNNVKITADTKDVISFENYKHKDNETRTEIIKYCNGNGTYSHTNISNAWESITTGNHTCANCTGTGHSMRTFDVSIESYKNINLGLFEREQPDVAIFSDISKVKVTMQGQEYTYLYNVRSNEKNNVGLKVKFENKDTYTYQRPVNPADIAYINETNQNVMTVDVTYEIRLANLSTTLPITIHNIKTYFDNRYTLTTTGWAPSTGTSFNTATKTGGLNVTINPGADSEAIELTYSVSLEAIRKLLNEDATLNHAVEIESYSTKYGTNTLYAEQRTGGRNNQPYGGYDNDSHPGNAGIHINNEGRLAAINMEDDTDIAPSFVLCKDEKYYKILSGNVWEDSDANAEDGYRLGDGKKSDTDKNVENVKVELYKAKDGTPLEIAQLYYLNTDTAEVTTKDAITYTDSNGNYAFGDKKYSVVTDEYIIKFTYGEGIDGSVTSTINGSPVSARDYKSTIISSENESVYNLFKETSTSDEWHLNISKGYSIAVDTIGERAAISDLQYGNFGDKLSISAWSKPFTMQIEFDANKQSSVDILDEYPKIEDTILVDGITRYYNELNVFDFGIIERAREDIFVETSVEHLKITLANGQVLTQGDPRVDELNYAKPIGFNQEINNGTAARNALEKQVLIELDAELMQGAELEVKYSIEVTNNSEKDIDIDDDDNGQYKTEFYYFGTNNEGAKEVETSVNYVVDYLDSELTYTWENAEDWQQKSADELLNEGLISEATYNAIKENEYATYITTKFSNLKPGESMTDHVSAKKLLANQDENIYDNHAEILKIDAKTARTIKQTGASKEYKMGNYVPSLAARVINTDINAEKAGLHEQDDDRLKIVITPPTGATIYIITYVITGLLGLIVIGAVIIFIKKKVLTK